MGDNVIKLYNKAEVKKYESCVEHFEFFLLIAVTPCPFSPEMVMIETHADQCDLGFEVYSSRMQNFSF